MKAKLSYKSKRNIVISAIIAVLIVAIGTGTYFFTKGNDDTQAFTGNNSTTVGETNLEGGTQAEENGETNPEDGENQNQGQTPEENGNQGDAEQTTNNNETTGNTGNQGNTGTTGTTTGDVPNQDYVTERVEQQDVLVGEDYIVEWRQLAINANTTTANLSIVRPIITATKTADKTAIVSGEELTYTITLSNSGRADGVAVVKDTIPEGTTFVENSIKVNGEDTNYTVEDLTNGINVDVAKQNENGEDGKSELSFKVTVKEDVTGNIENVATVNEEETEKVKSPVVTFEKTVNKDVAKVGDTLTYTITATNTGSKAGTIIVKDTIPEGTFLIATSFTINGKYVGYENCAEELSKGIEYELKENETLTITFDVKVTEEVSRTIENIAYVNDKPTEGKQTKVESKIVFEENGGKTVEDMNGYTGETIEDTNMPTTTKIGYILDGWYKEATLENKVEVLPEKYPAGTTTYYAKWIPRDDTKYIVEYYYQKDDGTYPVATDLIATDNRIAKGTTDTGASVTEQDRTPKAVTGKTYVFDSRNKNNVLRGNIAGDGSLVLKVYFKQQYTVTYKPGTKGTFEEQSIGSLDYEAKTPKYTGKLTGESGYTFTGWNPEVKDKVTGNQEYVAQWEANTDTKYIVEYYYQKDDGAYLIATELKATDIISRKGTTDTEATVTKQDKTPNKVAGKTYVFDSENTNNVLSGNIAGNGSLVLKVYFKQQYTVTYKPGTKGTFEEQKTENLDYGANIPEYSGEKDESGNPTGEAGYTFAGWNPEVIGTDTVTENKVYEAQWKANTDTKYTVEYYYQKDNGTYPTQEELVATDKRMGEGTTDTGATVTEQDKTPKATTQRTYVFDSKNTNNVLSGNIAGDGSLVLKVYFKQQYTVTYKPGTKGTFTEQPVESLDYGAETPEYNGEKDETGNPGGNPGYTFAGWTPEIKETVTENQEYVAQWTPNTHTKYTVKHWRQQPKNENGAEYKEVATDTRTYYGTTGELATYVPKNNYRGFTYQPDLTTPSDKTIKGDGSLVINLYYTRNSYNYVTEYYYEGTTTEDWQHDEIDNITKSAEYEAVIEEYENKEKTGYIFSKTENLPLTIKDNEAENVIKVYYVRAERDYVINYYHDSISEDNFIDKVPGTAKHGDTITADTTKFVPDGYKFEGTAPSMVIKQDGNVIDVVYVKKDCGYKVEYYYNDVLDHTFNGTQQYNSVVDSYEARPKDGYIFFEAKAAGKTSKTEGKISLTITDNEANNIIKVYYYSKPTVTIEKTADKTNVNAGDSITYSIKLTNSGKINSEPVKVTDTLPAGLTDVEVIGTDKDKATVSGNTITWENVVVEPETKTLKVSAKVKDNIIGSTLTNTATINRGGEESSASTVSTEVKELSVSATGVIPGGIAKQNVNVVLVIDTSDSMNKDVNGNKPNETGLSSRYSIAKEVMKDFVNALYEEENQSTLTIVSFNTKASIVRVNGKATSVYADKSDILAQIDNIERKPGTNMYGGLSLAGYTIDSLNEGNSQFKDNKDIIVFLGDGHPGWAEEPGKFIDENRANGIISKATEIKNKGTEIYTIGFGNEAADSSKAGDAGNETPEEPGSAYYILNNMASPNKFYTAVTGPELVEAFNKIKDQEIKTDVTTNKGVVEIDLKGHELKTPVSVTYKGKKIISCPNIEDLAKYNMEYKDGKLTWNVNAWNSGDSNTKVISSDLVINYRASK